MNRGPLFDDYFLTWEGGSLFRAQVTSYADGRDQALSELSRLLQSRIDLRLADSTDWKSRIVGPPARGGNPYFTFVEAQPRNWRERLSPVFHLGRIVRFFRHYDSEFKRQP